MAAHPSPFPILARPFLQEPSTDAEAVAAFSRGGGLGVLAPGGGLPGNLHALRSTGLAFALQLDHPPDGHLVDLLARHPVPVLIAPGDMILPGCTRLHPVRTAAEADRAAAKGDAGLLLVLQAGADPVSLVRNLVTTRADLVMAVSVPDHRLAEACLAAGAVVAQVRSASAPPSPIGPGLARQDRESREAAALRENLRRRKVQARRPSSTLHDRDRQGN